MKKYQSYPFEISGLNPAGKGLATLDDVQTTIPFGLPGQQVQAQVVKKKRDQASARVQAVLRRRPDEIAPACAHFGQPPDTSGRGCGGCQWQTLPYASQLALKRELLQNTLAGLVPAEAWREIIGSPLAYRYRNKVELSFGDKVFIPDEEYRALRAAKTPLPQGFYLGFHVPGSFGTVVPLRECHLVSEPMQQIFQALSQLLPTLGADVYSPRHHTGYWRHLILREGVRSGEIMVHFNTTDTDAPDWSAVLNYLNGLDLPAGSRIRSVLHSVHTGDAQIVGWNPPTLLQGETVISDSLCGLDFEISPYAFFQTNTLAAERLYQAVVALADLRQAPVVYDLYSGTGTIGMILAHHGARAVYGLEEIESAVADAQRNAARNQLQHCHFAAGKVEARFSELMALHPPDLVVVDPPRVGLHKNVSHWLNSLALPQLIYVSCNPAALARDLEILQAVYTVEVVQPVDLFPQTGHVETIVRLVRRP
ncbi:MAG: 23S rRNA (uracil(1939)-C(5))-methyltransferase RlmD [Candidatus Sericytochromatia bacterium]|nr:23S rRNA (uracil(1939)-C(5))-methyltransferase RlmD [Candidatus Sericytochromatia bacterium]